MKEFKINENQLQTLWHILGKFPAIKVLGAIDMIRNLTLLESNNPLEDEKKPD